MSHRNPPPSPTLSTVAPASRGPRPHSRCVEPATGRHIARPGSDAGDMPLAVAAAHAVPAWSALPQHDAPPAERLADALEARLTNRPRRVAAMAASRSRSRASRDPARHREPGLLRRRGDPVLQRSAPWRSRAQLHAARAARRGRLHLAVEPAAVSVHLEDRAGAGGRQHGRRQAVRGHADDGVHARRTGSEAGFPPGVLNIVHGLAPKSASRW